MNPSLEYSFVAFAVGAGLAVESTSERTVGSSSERKSTEHQQFVRRSHNTSSVRPMRTSQSRTSSMTQLQFQRAMFMQASLRMHRNTSLLHSMPSVVRQPVLTRPIPRDWTTVRSLRAQRQADARVVREDSYITSAENEPDYESVNTAAQKALPCPDSEVQEPLPTTVKQLSSSPKPMSRQRRNSHQRQAAAAVDSNNLVVDGADSRPSTSENEEPLLTVPVPTNVAAKVTDVDSILSDATTRQRQRSTTARPSLIFEKVHLEPVVKNRRRVTERRLPLQESSV